MLSAFSSLGERSGIALRFEASTPEITLYFDPDKLEKIITNLLSNAFKFTMSAGAVTVCVHDAPYDAEERGTGAFITLQVADTGVGIPPKALPLLFDRFYQVDASPTRPHEGSGIGLALVRELVDLHGGSITVESEVGKGTVFSLRMPKGADHLTEEEIVLERESGGKGERESGREGERIEDRGSRIEDRRRCIEDCAEGGDGRSGPGCLPDGCASIRRS